MKYYKIKIATLYNNNNWRFRSQADGKYILNADYYFYKIRNGDILNNPPTFDYFILRNYDELSFPDTELLDVHSFIGEGSQILGWFISEDLKMLFEKFNLSNPHAFYLSKLLYKKNNLDYYIFQFAGKLISEILETQINFSKCLFWDTELQTDSFVKSSEDFASEYMSIFDKKIILRRLAIQQSYDFFPMSTFLHDNLISERLKTAIEEMGITGFEFSELGYEVVVEE